MHVNNKRKKRKHKDSRDLEMPQSCLRGREMPSSGEPPKPRKQARLKSEESKILGNNTEKRDVLSKDEEESEPDQEPPASPASGDTQAPVDSPSPPLWTLPFSDVGNHAWVNICVLPDSYSGRGAYTLQQLFKQAEYSPPPNEQPRRAVTSMLQHVFTKHHAGRYACTVKHDYSVPLADSLPDIVIGEKQFSDFAATSLGDDSSFYEWVAERHGDSSASEYEDSVGQAIVKLITIIRITSHFGLFKGYGCVLPKDGVKSSMCTVEVEFIGWRFDCSIKRHKLADAPNAIACSMVSAFQQMHDLGDAERSGLKRISMDDIKFFVKLSDELLAKLGEQTNSALKKKGQPPLSQLEQVEAINALVVREKATDKPRYAKIVRNHTASRLVLNAMDVLSKVKCAGLPGWCLRVRNQEIFVSGYYGEPFSESLSPGRVYTLFLPALACIHQEGIALRDVRRPNLLLRDDEVFVIDYDQSCFSKSKEYFSCATTRQFFCYNMEGLVCDDAEHLDWRQFGIMLLGMLVRQANRKVSEVEVTHANRKQVLKWLRHVGKGRDEWEKDNAPLSYAKLKDLIERGVHDAGDAQLANQ